MKSSGTERRRAPFEIGAGALLKTIEGNGHLENPGDGALLTKVSYVIDIWQEVLTLPDGETLDGHLDLQGHVHGFNESSLKRDQDVMLFLDDHRQKILIQVVDGRTILPVGKLKAQ